MGHLSLPPKRRDWLQATSRLSRESCMRCTCLRCRERLLTLVPHSGQLGCKGKDDMTM